MQHKFPRGGVCTLCQRQKRQTLGHGKQAMGNNLNPRGRFHVYTDVHQNTAGGQHGLQIANSI